MTGRKRRHRDSTDPLSSLGDHGNAVRVAGNRAAPRVLALIGSRRKGGNTARIVGLIDGHMHALAARHGEGLDFETLFLGDLDIQPCRGCRACFDRGEDACPLRDDTRYVRAEMDAADALLLASPVYVNAVSGLVKNWMDRLAYLCHRPALGGRCAYAVATVGGGPLNHALQTMTLALRTWGYHVVGQAGYKMGPLLPQAEVESRCGAQAATVAKRLYGAIRRQRYLQPTFLDLVVFRIQQLA